MSLDDRDTAALVWLVNRTRQACGHEPWGDGGTVNAVRACEPRPFPAIAAAAIRWAANPAARTPGGLPKPGPHWRSDDAPPLPRSGPGHRDETCPVHLDWAATCRGCRADELAEKTPIAGPLITYAEARAALRDAARGERKEQP